MVPDVCEQQRCGHKQASMYQCIQYQWQMVRHIL